MDRFVIFPSEIHVPFHAQTDEQGPLSLFFQRGFRAASSPIAAVCVSREKVRGWGDDMITGLQRLYEQGFAASVEVWDNDQALGGIYGVTIGSSFFGESMFSLVPSAE